MEFAFRGTAKMPHVNGTTGADHLTTTVAGDIVDGKAGTDLIDIDRSASSHDLSYNAIAAATSSGTSLGDGTTIKNVEQLGVLSTGSGNDTLTVSAAQGAFTWFANSGHDTLIADYSARTDSVVAGINAVDGWGGYEISTPAFYNDYEGDNLATAYNIEAVSMTGGSGDDSLGGTDGDDILNGGAGNDYLATGRGNDVVDGGMGTDTLDLDRASLTTDFSFDALAAATATGFVTGGLTVKNVENLYLLQTGSGNDTLTVSAAQGAFTWFANGGHDTLIADYSARTDSVVAGINAVDGWGGYEISTPAYYNDYEGDNLATAYDIEAVSMTGGSGNDSLGGTDGNDTLNGGAGDDHLYAGKGVDNLDGGDGYDTIGFDRSDLTTDFNFDAVAALTSAGTTIGTATVKNVEGLDYLQTGSGNDTLTVSAAQGALTWYANGGHDVLIAD